MEKVEIKKALTTHDLQNQVNEFLAKKGINILQLQYSTAGIQNRIAYTALIHYTTA